jgi:hypothetical protein
VLTLVEFQNETRLRKIKIARRHSGALDEVRVTPRFLQGFVDLPQGGADDTFSVFIGMSRPRKRMAGSAITVDPEEQMMDLRFAAAAVFGMKIFAHRKEPRGSQCSDHDTTIQPEEKTRWPRESR